MGGVGYERGGIWEGGDMRGWMWDDRIWGDNGIWGRVLPGRPFKTL